MKPLSDEVKAMLENGPRWEPIATAPRDGSEIVVGIDWAKGMSHGFARWVDDRWDVRPFDRPWPLPSLEELPTRDLTHWLAFEETDPPRERNIPKK